MFSCAEHVTDPYQSIKDGLTSGAFAGRRSDREVIEIIEMPQTLTRYATALHWPVA